MGKLPKALCAQLTQRCVSYDAKVQLYTLCGTTPRGSVKSLVSGLAAWVTWATWELVGRAFIPGPGT